MSRIENMTVREIISEVGLNLVGMDIQTIFDNEEEKIERFSQELENIRNRKKLFLQISGEMNQFIQRNGRMNQFIQRNGRMNEIEGSNFTAAEIRAALLRMDDAVDKEALVVLCLYNSQIDLEEKSILSKGEKRDIESRVRAAMKLIGNMDFTIVERTWMEDKTLELKIINSTRLVQCIKSGNKIANMNNPNKKQTERFDKIKQAVGIESIAMGLFKEDMVECSTNEVIGACIESQMYWNALQKYTKTHPEIDMDEIIKNGNVPEEVHNQLCESLEMKQSMIEAMEQYFQFMDLDRLIFMSWQRLITGLERDIQDKMRSKTIGDNGEIIEQGKEETVNGMRETIQGMTRVIKPETTISIEDTTYTVKDIEISLRRFKDGRYIRSDEIADAKIRTLSGQTTLGGEDEQILSCIDFSASNFDTLIRYSEANMIFLINQGIIDAENIKETLYLRETCSPELFALINQKGLLGYEEMLEFFDAGMFSSEMILSIKDEETKQKIKEATTIRVRELQLAVLDEENDKPRETMENFSRYAALYKKINIDGKSEEEIAEASFSLISSFEENLTDEVLKGLYQFGIITIEAAADWGMDLTGMLSEGNVKPTDVKGLFAKKLFQ